MFDDGGGLGGDGAPARVRAVRLGRPARVTLTGLLLAGAAACSASPQYPISMGERPGNGGLMAQQPRYPVSARDADQNARDVRAGRAYPAYGEPTYAGPHASPYAPPPAPAAAPAPADDQADDAPRGLHSAPVESSDLPPPGASDAQPADAPPPPPPPSGYDAPHAQAISFGGGQIVFGTDSLAAPALELAAYHHRRHHAAATSESADDTAAADAKPSRKGRRRHGKADETADTAPDAGADTAKAAADTPYQTVVRPGEKLSEVAERVHASKDALIQLNDLKHPRHVHAGTVLKIPYKYSYEVQKGDTLYTISHRFGQDPSTIAKLNGLKTLPTLQPGQTLSLPSDVHDEGKRDHAAAEGPAPEAAPAKLADAAIRKIERKSRRRHGREVEVASAAASDETQAAAAEPTRRGRHRRGLEPTPIQTAEASSIPPAPIPTPTQEVPAAAPATPPPAPVVTAAAPAVRSAPVRSYTPPASSTPAVASGGYYAGVRPSGPPATAYASTAGATPSPSTYAAPGYAASGYAARTTGGEGQVASLNTPRYSPSYPAGGYAPSLGRERPTAQTPTVGAVNSAQISAAGRGRFIWPIRGQITSTFGDKPSGEHNDGMDIAATPGTAVKAAAGGEVVYAGSAIPGYGNLVLVKHAGGWVTAYAHLDRIEVRMKDTVSQGDEIGQAGANLAGARPGLHFEVRYAPSPIEKARPVDPSLVLPAG